MSDLKSKINLKKISWIAVALLPLFFLVKCGPSISTWKEEVKLQAGDIITVRRTISFKEYQPIGGGGGGSDTPESSLEIVEPIKPDNPQRWTQPHLLPMIFDQDPDTKEWFIVATFHMCSTWRDLGRPKLPYLEFRYRAGSWSQQPLSEKFIHREGNMLIPNQAHVNRDHTIDSKHEIMSKPTISPRYLHVIKEWKDSCAGPSVK